MKIARIEPFAYRAHLGATRTAAGDIMIDAYQAWTPDDAAQWHAPARGTGVALAAGENMRCGAALCRSIDDCYRGTLSPTSANGGHRRLPRRGARRAHPEWGLNPTWLGWRVLR